MKLQKATLESKLLQPVSEPIGKSNRWGRLAESLYVGVCVIAQRPVLARQPLARDRRGNRDEGRLRAETAT